MAIANSTCRLNHVVTGFKWKRVNYTEKFKHNIQQWFDRSLPQTTKQPFNLLLFFLRMGHSQPLFLCFCLFYFNAQLVDKILLMLGFDPRVSGVRSDRSTNWATTTARNLTFICNYFAAEHLKTILHQIFLSWLPQGQNFFLTFMIFSSSSLEPWALREFQATTSICRNVKIMHFLCRNISFGCGASRAYRTFLLKGGRRRLEGSTCFNRNSFCPSSRYPIFARNAAL